jgi:hypothetical protein
MGGYSVADGYRHGRRSAHAWNPSEVGRLAAARYLFVALLSALPLCAQPKLAIERIALHQFEDGPILALNHEFVPGETIELSCRLAGFHIEKKDEKQYVKLAWQVSAVDASGVLLEKEVSGRIDETVLPQDKNWIPKFLATFIVPSFAPTGVYRISVKVKDEFSGMEATSELPFHVRGHDVAQSETLVANNVQFLRGENDQMPMRSVVYHPGETLWARFDISGYKFGPNNLFEVNYGLAVLNGEGVQLFAEPEAASESNHSFYPQRYVPGVLSLHLDPNVPKGPYTLVITVGDKIGGQKYESRQRFEVE